MNKYVPGTIPGVDPRTARMIQELYERTNQLQGRIDEVEANILPPGAKKETPQAGLLYVPGRGQDGFARISPDGVIVSYTNPTEDTYPYVDLRSIGNIGGGTDTLHSFDLPANDLAKDGDYLDIFYRGFYANNANTKQILITIGGTTLFDTGASDLRNSISVQWEIRLSVFRISSTVLRAGVGFSAHFFGVTSAAVPFTIGAAGGLVIAQGIDVTVADLSLNTTAFIVTCQGTADNDIVQNVTRIERYRAKQVKLV